MLTEANKATNYDTFRHVERVRNLLNMSPQLTKILENTANAMFK